MTVSSGPVSTAFVDIVRRPIPLVSLRNRSEHEETNSRLPKTLRLNSEDHYFRLLGKDIKLADTCHVFWTIWKKIPNL